MRGKFLRASAGILLVGLMVVITGCGGGSSSSSSGTPASSTAEPSAQFIKKKGDNSIAEFGEEASADEREAANVVVVESLQARASGDFQTQCETLNAKGIEAIPGAKGQGDCVTALTKFAEPLATTKHARKDTLSGSIAALRIKGNQGYALYHGNDGNNYELPLEKEDGVWKLSSVFSTEM